MKRFMHLLLAALMLFTSAFAADGTSNVYQGYTYDFFRNVKSTPLPFVLSQVIDSNTVTKTGGFEQMRLFSDDEYETTTGTRYTRFDSKYFYLYGTNYYLNVYFRF